jgi:acetate kinase
MGFTPLEGLVMGTRSGDIDPAAVEFLRAKLNLKPEEVVNYLNKKCGILGISGFSSDCRDLTAASEEGNERATLALEMLAYRVKKYVGSYIAVLGGVDAIVFTGGIGENSDLIRKLVMEDMEYCGAKIDLEKNAVRGTTYINTEDSKVKVMVVPTNEELSIARETKALTC